MTTLRESVAQALDALTKIHPGNMSWETCVAWLNAVQILREALAQPEPKPVAWMDREGDLYKMPEIEGWAPPHTFLYTSPPQHPTETEAEYGSEADTEELLRVGAMPEPLRLAAMLEKTMQWPLHGIAADCLRRMHNEAQRKPLTVEQLRDIKEHQRLLEELGPVWAPMLYYFCQAIERAHGIGGEE